MIKWTMVTDGLPPIEDEALGRSDTILCQDAYGDVNLGYVQYYPGEQFDPVWRKKGRGGYEVGGVIRWIYLYDILSEIS